MKVSVLQNGVATIVAMSGGLLVIDRISEDGVRIVNTETGSQLIVVLHNDELLFKGESVSPSETYITHPAIRGLTDGSDEVCEDCDYDNEEDDEDDYEEEEDEDNEYDDEDEDDEEDEVVGFAICIIG